MRSKFRRRVQVVQRVTVVLGRPQRVTQAPMLERALWRELRDISGPVVKIQDSIEREKLHAAKLIIWSTQFNGWRITSAGEIVLRTGRLL